MDVDVTLFSNRTVTLSESATVQSLLDQLEIDGQEVESIYVNGKEANFDKHLNGGDRITFLPSIGGG